MSDTPTAAAQFIERVTARVKSGIFAMLLPLLMELFKGLMESCEVEGQRLVDACAKPSKKNARKFRRSMASGAIAERREHGWGVWEAYRNGIACANAFMEEGKDTAARCSSGESDVDPLELIEELTAA